MSFRVLPLASLVVAAVAMSLPLMGCGSSAPDDSGSSSNAATSTDSDVGGLDSPCKKTAECSPSLVCRYAGETFPFTQCLRHGEVNDTCRTDDECAVDLYFCKKSSPSDTFGGCFPK